MFKTKADRPQWQIVYDRLATMDIDDVVKDADLSELLPDAPEASIRSAFTRAVRQIEDDRKRTFARVRLVGYRMVAANEHEGLARGQHKKAKRSLRRAIRKTQSADRSLLNHEERRRVDAIEENLANQARMIRRLESQVERLDEGLKTARREQRTSAAAVSERLDSLSALLARHGITEEVGTSAT